MLTSFVEEVVVWCQIVYISMDKFHRIKIIDQHVLFTNASRSLNSLMQWIQRVIHSYIIKLYDLLYCGITISRFPYMPIYIYIYQSICI